MKTIAELPDMEVITEIDDVHIARMIVDELHCVGKLDRMWYMAKWVARLREHYVAIGADAALADYAYKEKSD